MNKKEFIKRMNKIKKKKLNHTMCYTCDLIKDEFYNKGLYYYRKIIKPYMVSDCPIISNSYIDINNSRGAVRILALTTFEIECLESGIYKEF